jgi:diadenosine tetraphosphate (Ap4A) HIT family hydrolase
MPTMIHERVRLAHYGKNPYVITRLKSGWLVIGDVQPLPGYCLLLSDPVVCDLNSLSEAKRADYCLDMARIGDALLLVTDAYRINYETWGNTEQALHTHITPRYQSEIAEKRGGPFCLGYGWKDARPYDLAQDKPFMDSMRIALKKHSL